MDYKLGFIGQYVSAVELGTRSPTLKIRRVQIEKVEQIQKGQAEGDGKVRDRLVVYFEGPDRGMILNRTNAECIVAMFGRETEQWIGKSITIHAVPVRVGGKTEPGIRIKGSPDIDRPLTFDLVLPRKKPTSTTLHPTGTKKTTAEVPPEALPVTREPGEEG